MSAFVGQPFFEIVEDDHGEWFTPTDACRGPWSADACHAGPPTGLLVRESEQLVPDQQLTRITVELIRPIPHAGFRVRGEIVRRGRTVSTTAMTIADRDGRPVVTARAMHVATRAEFDAPTAVPSGPRLSEAVPGRFPIDVGLHGLPMISDAVEIRYPPGHDHSVGPTALWMRTGPLVAGRHASGFQRICTLADCGNGTSRNADPDVVAFMNTDLTIAFHREPRGEWFHMDAASRWEPNGVGMSDAVLFDEQGPVGRAVQTIVLQPAS